MDYRMYGFDENYKDLFHDYKNAGITSVVSGINQDAINAANDIGIDYYVCLGAFGTSDEKEFCLSVNGLYTPWFNSGCPNNPSLKEKGLSKTLNIEKAPRISGLIIDGARFASPASAEGIDAFFTCFCPYCIAKMAMLGFDSSNIFESVLAFYNLIKLGQEFDIDKHIDELKDWLSFRRICTTEYLKNFYDSVKSVNPNIEVGIYIFSPSIASLVGQSYEDISLVYDFLSPMVYRHYKHSQAAACLDHEIAAILKYCITNNVHKRETILKTFSMLTDIDYGGFGTYDELLKQGLPSKYVGTEIAKAVSISRDCPVIPIILLDDSNLDDSITAAKKSIQKLDFYVYNKESFEMALPIFRKASA